MRHRPNRIVVVVIGRGKPQPSAIREDLAASGIEMHLDEQLAQRRRWDGATWREITQGGIGLGPMVSITRISSARSFRWPPSHSNTVLSMAAPSTAPDKIICNELGMGAGFHRRGKKMIDFAEIEQMRAHDVETGMGARLVVSPGRATQVTERSASAVPAHHHIGKIHGSRSVALSRRYRHGEQLHAALGKVGLVHVG